MDHNRKDWNEIKSNDSWSIFKIMSEFVEAYDRMSKIGPCVAIFGSARTKPENPYYQLSEQLAERLASKGFGIISGGGPGIMEAANKGAQQGKDHLLVSTLICLSNKITIHILTKSTT